MPALQSLQRDTLLMNTTPRPMDKFAAQRLAGHDAQRETRLQFTLSLLTVTPPAPKLVWTCTCGYEHQTTYFGGEAECGCGRCHEWRKVVSDPAAYEAAEADYLAWLDAGNSSYIKPGTGA